MCNTNLWLGALLPHLPPPCARPPRTAFPPPRPPRKMFLRPPKNPPRWGDPVTATANAVTRKTPEKNMISFKPPKKCEKCLSMNLGFQIFSCLLNKQYFFSPFLYVVTTKL